MTNEQPLVSVLMSAYNHEAYVEEAIRSVLTQTYGNIELLVVDDGSSDATWQKLQAIRSECEAGLKRVDFRTQANAGTCVNLNRLISRMQGRYAYMIASDDVAKPDAIAREVAYMQTHPGCVLTVGDNEIIDAQGKRIGWNARQRACNLDKARYKTFAQYLRTKERLSEGELYGTFLRTNFIPNGYLVDGQALREIVFTREAQPEDYYLHLQLSKKGTYGYIDDILFSYRWHAGNTIRQKQRMRGYYAKTYIYEEKLVNNMENKRFAQLFRREKYRSRDLSIFGGMVRLSKKRDLREKSTVLTLMGRSITLRRRSV